MDECVAPHCQPFTMALTASGVAVVVPPDETSSWIEANQTGTYLGIVLLTMVAYDALCTIDKEVCALYEEIDMYMN